VRTVAPLQVMNLTMSLIAFFLLTSFAWFAAGFVVFREIVISRPVFVVNIALTGLLGWWWYRAQYHAVFSWDQQGFELTKGRGRKSIRKWQDFSQVSLVHEGYGRFLVRLYGDGGEYLDIPASALKLPPSDFRFEVLDLVKREQPADRVDEPI